MSTAATTAPTPQPVTPTTKDPFDKPVISWTSDDPNVRQLLLGLGIEGMKILGINPRKANEKGWVCESMSRLLHGIGLRTISREVPHTPPHLIDAVEAAKAANRAVNRRDTAGKAAAKAAVEAAVAAAKAATVRTRVYTIDPESITEMQELSARLLARTRGEKPLDAQLADPKWKQQMEKEMEGTSEMDDLLSAILNGDLPAFQTQPPVQTPAEQVVQSVVEAQVQEFDFDDEDDDHHPDYWADDHDDECDQDDGFRLPQNQMAPVEDLSGRRKSCSADHTFLQKTTP